MSMIMTERGWRQLKGVANTLETDYDRGDKLHHCYDNGCQFFYDGGSFARRRQPVYVASWLEQNGLDPANTAEDIRDQYCAAVQRFVSLRKGDFGFIDDEECLSMLGTKKINRAFLEHPMSVHFIRKFYER